MFHAKQSQKHLLGEVRSIGLIAPEARGQETAQPPPLAGDQIGYEALAFVRLQSRVLS
jgi:hypothetical protein